MLSSPPWLFNLVLCRFGHLFCWTEKLFPCIWIYFNLSCNYSKRWVWCLMQHSHARGKHGHALRQCREQQALGQRYHPFKKTDALEFEPVNIFIYSSCSSLHADYSYQNIADHSIRITPVKRYTRTRTQSHSAANHPSERHTFVREGDLLSSATEFEYSSWRLWGFESNSLRYFDNYNADYANFQSFLQLLLHAQLNHFSIIICSSLLSVRFIQNSFIDQY